MKLIELSMNNIVIFDFDDTITDNQKLDHHAFVIPCKKLGLKIPDAKYIKKKRKENYLAEEIIKEFLKDFKSNDIKKFLDERNKFLNSKKSMKYLELQSYTKYILYYLKRKKIRIILCTARKNKKNILDFLKERGINHYFDDNYFSEDYKINLDNRKSENRIIIKKKLLNKIIKSESINKNKIIFIGNSLEDYIAANKINLPFILYQNTYLEKSKIDKQIKKINSHLQLKKQIELLTRIN